MKRKRVQLSEFSQTFLTQVLATKLLLIKKNLASFGVGPGARAATLTLCCIEWGENALRCGVQALGRGFGVLN